MATAKPSKISEKLEKAINDLLVEVTSKTSKAALDDKLKVIDRSLKLEALKAKMGDEEYGSAFSDD